jgi:diguanylate cyclase (GGDEF)-like protein/PAS domain S-box-containing protein
MKRSSTRLRSAAEAKLARLPHPESSSSSAADLLQELQIHQIELEMQNEELRRTQLALEESRDRYMDLYEFAPVAYLTLTTATMISKINLTGAQLLGEERRNILHRRFEHFVAPQDQVIYQQMLSQIAERPERQTCALALRGPEGSLVHVQLDCVPVKRGDTSMMRLTITDLTERKQAETEIANLAFYDPLTRLPNRRLLLDRVLQASYAAHRTSKHGALLSVDLDNFKLLNDTQGHDAGDRLLQQAARRLTACVREVDTVGRLGGDEFVLLLQDLSEEPGRAAIQARAVGEKILACLAEPYLLANQEYRSTGSMGITLFSSVREPVEVMLKRADLALYRAKAAGGGNLQFFDPEFEIAFQARATLEADLRKGIEERQFVLHYQPQVNEHGSVTGFEALVRWKHPRRGLLWPGEFITLAEEKGLISSLGQLVLESACSQLLSWGAEPETSHWTLAVNVSTSEFYHPDLVPRTLEIVRRAGINPGKLFLEITESLMLRNVEETIGKMHTLRAHGMRFSLDDFGMGFSSLAYLKSLPLDQLKIDGSFVRDVLTDSSDAAIVRTIMTLGRTLGLSVIAEGVETHGQKDFLAAHGCHAYQGNLFGKPQPAQDLLLQEGSTRYTVAG